MNDHSQPEPGPPANVNGRAQENHVPMPGENPIISGLPRNGVHPNGRPQPAHLNLWVAMDLLFQRWHWVVLGVLICGAGFYELASGFVKPKFTAVAQLRRLDPRGVSDTFKGTPISADTFASLIKSENVLRKVGEESAPPV